MPYADHAGVQIYYEVHGRGPPVVLHHGFTCSTAEWHEAGYVAGLEGDYRLILLDSRGHGRSDKPHDSESYEFRLRAHDVVAVLDDLGVDRAHFFGYSLGGRIGLDLAWHAPDRVRSLIVGASHPYRNPPTDASRRAFERGMAAWIDGLPSVIAPPVRARMLAADTRALSASAAVDRPSLEGMLPTLPMPCLAYAGSADPILPRVEEFMRLVPNGTVFSLPGFDHWGGFYHAADQVLPRIRAFLTDASESTAADLPARSGRPGPDRRRGPS
jgi:pimeloyl-ACP methyl ester carboxylesterase